MRREATCACGGLAARCTGEPLKVSLCHCLECQKRTGSAFGIATFFEHENMSAGGASNTFTRASDSGFDVTFHFCPTCGTTVFWYPLRMPHLVAVAAGCFADPAFPRPTQSVYVESRHPWLAVED
ncbi:GFA family protein [Mesorhizobium sp. CAU 1732]|uniref:GFA family protein n=1 Tax=Mesorhizobium sp. CAU 1732 TaxID=3140358 RepID=UPI003261A66C